MPIIKLTPTERLTSTLRTWESQYLKVRKHRMTKELIESWKLHRNYTSLESALTDVVNTRIRASKQEGMCVAIQQVKDWMASLGKALTQSLINDITAIIELVEKEGLNHGSKS